jgi:hypothetical protein
MPPLPDVLSQPGIMKGEELRRESCVSAFEGTAPLTLGRVVKWQRGGHLTLTIPPGVWVGGGVKGGIGDRF